MFNKLLSMITSFQNGLDNMIDRLESFEEYVYKKGLKINESIGQADSAANIDIFYMHAELCIRNGKYDEAEECYNKAITIIKNPNDKERYKIIGALCHLANIYKLRGKFSKAELIYKEAISYCKNTNHLEMAKCHNDLGELYLLFGDTKKAEIYLNQAYDTRVKLLAPNHTDIATSFNNIGMLCNIKGGEKDEVESLFRRALSIRESIFKSDHPDIAASLNNLAELYRSDENYDEAEPLYKRALDIRAVTHGNNHPDTAEIMCNLALLYISLGNIEKAEPLIHQAQKMRKKMLGTAHPAHGDSLDSSGLLFQIKGNYDAAIMTFREAIKFREKTLGPEHPYTGNSNYNMGLFYVRKLFASSTHDFVQAETYLTRALEIFESEDNRRHRLILKALIALKDLYVLHKYFQKSETISFRILGIYEKVHGSDHPRTTSIREDIEELKDLIREQEKY